MNIKNALLAATVLVASPVLAQAQPITGLYIGGGGGVNFLQNEKVVGSSLPAPGAPAHLIFQPGWVGVGSLGYGIGNGIRMEIEGDFRTNHPRSSYPVRSSSDGSEVKYGAMFNALYDFDLIGISGYGVAPYLGLGAGWSHNKLHGLSIADGASTVHINSEADVAAFQGIAGVAVPLNSITPGLAMTVEYRLMEEPGSSKYNSVAVTPTGNFGTRTKLVNDVNHSVMVGLRYALNTPEPAAAVVVPPPVAALAPQPAPSRSYLLFFDWDKSNLSSRAQQIIADAAQNAQRVQYTRIDVTGNADLTGTHEYNMALSRRRADVVAAELEHDGVARAAINVIAAGDTKPLIPTAEGVREPQNRRVEIVIH